MSPFHFPRNLQGVCGPGGGLTHGTVADEPGEVGGVCGAGTLFRIARSDHSLDLDRLISRTAEYGPVRSVVWEGGAARRPPYPDLIARTKPLEMTNRRQDGNKDVHVARRFSEPPTLGQIRDPFHRFPSTRTGLAALRLIHPRDNRGSLARRRNETSPYHLSQT